MLCMHMLQMLRCSDASTILVLDRMPSVFSELFGKLGHCYDPSGWSAKLALTILDAKHCSLSKGVSFVRARRHTQVRQPQFRPVRSTTPTCVSCRTYTFTGFSTETPYCGDKV